MNDWQRVNDLFHRALDEPPEAREAFLDGACAERPDLRAEVASLLAAHVRAGEFIERPAGDVAGLLPVPHQPGEQLGPYRIDRVVGAGGMGIVYRAEDTRLGRFVALKAVAPRFARDHERRERLRREARAAAALSHPGIATVFALEEIDGELYIASEYVAGETLRDELRRARLSVEQALETALEIARALAAAHARGIVHRDLKPENVMRAPDGRLKVLDFGLARFPDVDPSLVGLTVDGSRLGTPAYMAPEQIRGDPVDFRADLFAFGVLLYELGAGVHPFAADDPAATIARVLESDPPDLLLLRPGRDLEAGGWRAVAAIAGVCLQKAPGARFQSTQELVDALVAARDRGEMPARAGAEDAGRRPPGSAIWWWRFHQAATSVAYAAMLVPLDAVRESTPGPPGLGLFLIGLVAVLVSATLRLHLWFTSRWYPSEWVPQRRQSASWIRAADAGFVVVQLAGAAVIAADRPRLATLMVAVAVAAFLSFVIIEPATTRAAFGTGRDLTQRRGERRDDG